MKLSLRLAFSLLLLAPCTVHSSWYWPFGDDGAETGKGASAVDDGREKNPPRLSELIEPATTNIDAAADYAADGNTQKAIECYRAALAELDRIERENPERAASPEFTTVRTKRAYVNANIDSMLLAEAANNARSVVVTDTTSLERQLKEKKAAERNKAAKKDDVTDSSGAKADRPKLEKQLENYVAGERKRDKKIKKAAAVSRQERTIKKKITRLLKEDPNSRKARMMQANEHLRKGEVAEAKAIAVKLLDEKANDAATLNLRAACEVAEGDLKAAEKTLDVAIQSNPRNYHAYYNMANLCIERGNLDSARRYYETGRTFNGPKMPDIEKAVKAK